MNTADVIACIWERNGIDLLSNSDITSEQFSALEVPSVGDPVLAWYGKYCGPGTNNGGKNPDAINCLDFTCKLHDTYFRNPNSDLALSESAEYLLEKGMIKGRPLQEYAESIDSPMFAAMSTCWRNVGYTALVLVAILLITTGTCIGCIFAYKGSQKKIQT